MAATAEIKVSVAAYNEIANALDSLGKKFAPDTPLTIEKDTKIVNPLDWRLIQVRKDAVEAAVKVYAESDIDGNQTVDNFTIFTNEIYDFILKGTVPDPKGLQAPKKPTKPKPVENTPQAKWGK